MSYKSRLFNKNKNHSNSVFLFTATFPPKTMINSYGIYATGLFGERRSIVKYGKLSILPKDAIEAEFMAICNGLTILNNRFSGPRIHLLSINVNNKYLFDILSNPSQKSTVSFELIDIYQQLINKLDPIFVFLKRRRKYENGSTIDSFLKYTTRQTIICNNFIQ